MYLHCYVCNPPPTHTHTKNRYLSYKEYLLISTDQGLHRKLTLMCYSQTQILELKRSHPLKTILTIKTTTETKVNHLKCPVEEVKSETRVERKYMK